MKKKKERLLEKHEKLTAENIYLKKECEKLTAEKIRLEQEYEALKQKTKK